MIRYLALAAVCLAVAACGTTTKASTPTGPAPSGYHGFVLRPPVRAPAFALRDQAGKTIGPADLRGHWVVVAFLYTHCPDVCPLIANNLAAAQKRLPDLRVLAISVDPKGDTPSAVRAFIAAHRLGPRFRYVTGSRAQLRPVWASYHIASTPGPRGIVSHSAFELLIDPQGRERLLYDAKLSAADLVQDLARL